MQHEVLFLQCSEVMSPGEVAKYVDPQVLANLKATDPSPFLRAYVVAHEGESRSRQIDGPGPVQRVIRWGRAKIEEINSKLAIGIQCFMSHNHDNSTEGRKSYGSVVGKGLKDIGGKLHAIAVAYFPPDVKQIAKTARAISAELRAVIAPLADGTYEADKIESISGLAISANASPAFPGAYALADLQCFEDNNNTMDLKEISFGDLMGELQRRNVHPTQAFPISNWEKDRNAQEVVQSLRGEIEKSYAEKLNELTSKHEQQLKDLSGQLGEYKTKAIRYEAAPEIERRMAEAKFPAPAITFAKENLDTLFRVGDDLDKSVDSYIEQMKVIHERAVKSGYNVGQAQTAPNPTPNGQDKDYSKPENNEFIPKRS